MRALLLVALAALAAVPLALASDAAAPVGAVALSELAPAERERRLAARRDNALGFRSCAHRREDAIECGLRFGDANGDGYITLDEIESVKQRYLSPAVRAAAWVLEKIGVETAEKMMRNCDFDRDGRISRSDFELSVDTCLATCKKVELIFSIVCDRAAAAEKKALHDKHAAGLSAGGSGHSNAGSRR